MPSVPNLFFACRFGGLSCERVHFFFFVLCFAWLSIWTLSKKKLQMSRIRVICLKLLLCMSKWSLKIRPIQAQFRLRLCAEKGKGNGNNDLQQKLSRSSFNNKYQQMFINRTLIPKGSLEKQKNLSFEARTSQSTQFWSSFNFVFLKSYLNVEVSNRLVDWAGTIRNKSTANN